MKKRTPLYDAHLRMGAKMVNFAGWEMAVHYGSLVQEHRRVRQDAGMFDVSHMTIVDLRGSRVRECLQYLLANNVDKLKQPGRALYSCMLNETGGVIDDLILYYMADDWYRVVANAVTHDRDLAWVDRQTRPFNVRVVERADLAMVAVQGPKACPKATMAMPQHIAEQASELGRFAAVAVDDWFIARTGYTGEDGFEVMLPAVRAEPLWNTLASVDVAPVGLGARDTLRLEAGMNLMGNDMDETTTPLESGLAWTVAWEPVERDFIGRPALERQRAKGPPTQLVGLILDGRGVLRAQQRVVVEGGGEGKITSGTYSPTLKASIALARVPTAAGRHCKVEIRGRMVSAHVVNYPFVRMGKAVA